MTKKGEIAKALLYLIGGTALIISAVTMPKATAEILKLMRGTKNYNKKKIKRSLEFLKRTELISISYEGDKTVIKLTKNGKKKVLKYKLDDLRLIKPKKWD